MKVFVYGTLKRGEHNNGILLGCGADFLTTAKTKKPRKLVVKGLPYLNSPQVEGGVQVIGEIWEVPDTMMWRLDQLEGHPTWYRREEDKFVDEAGNEWTAWVYYIIKEIEGEAHETYSAYSDVEESTYYYSYLDE